MSRLWLVVWLSGCAGTANTRLEAVHALTTRAREAGAYRCAPVLLARAESHADFAKIELGAGELIRAEHEIDLAENNAARALRDADSCLAVAVQPPPPAPPPPPVEDPDPDRDGILAPDDRCPDQPEDKDGFEDEDGCPDPDNDGDGVLDADDHCPNVAGPASNFGCPAPKLIVVHDDKIELKQKIHFATGKSQILPDSFPLLTEITEALKSRPKLRVRIEGHTDARGSSTLNMKLSLARAESVRAYLIAAGIDATRLTAQGFGSTQPIADNRTAAGREENRRVEFFLLGD